MVEFLRVMREKSDEVLKEIVKILIECFLKVKKFWVVIYFGIF